MPTPSKRAAWSLAALAVVALAAAPAALAQDAAEFDRIAAETAEIRGLPIEQEIVEAFLTRQELEQRLIADLAVEYPPDEAAADERAWEAFGLISEETDLADLVLDLYTEQVAGFYDPETDEMYLIGDDDELGAEEEYTYSHEVIHALQDQAFDLDAVQAPVEDGTDDDRAIAIVALIEGDAVVGSTEYLLDHPMLLGRLALVSIPDAPVFDAAPPILTQGLLFPYLAGQGFVTALREEGGWDAVDAAYADPPASTEQILHPEKYFERDDPTPVALPDLAAALGPGWTKAEENNFGEFSTAVLLADLEPGEGFDDLSGADLPDGARAAAAGWDGDRYAVWANGEDDVVVWRSVWDSADDAAEFGRALQAHDEARFGGLWEGETPDDVALVTDEVAARIAITDTTVTYVSAPTLALADQALGALREG